MSYPTRASEVNMFCEIFNTMFAEDVSNKICDKMRITLERPVTTQARTIVNVHKALITNEKISRKLDMSRKQFMPILMKSTDRVLTSMNIDHDSKDALVMMNSIVDDVRIMIYSNVPDSCKLSSIKNKGIALHLMGGVNPITEIPDDEYGKIIYEYLNDRAAYWKRAFDKKKTEACEYNEMTPFREILELYNFNTYSKVDSICRYAMQQHQEYITDLRRSE